MVAGGLLDDPRIAMTKFYPANPPERSPKSELKVRARLAQLDAFHVFHSVAWQSIRNGRQGDGEADFVVIDPNRGVLVLEVKGGGVELEKGLWYSTGADGIRHKIKNPFEQATSSKHALLGYLREVDKRLVDVPIGHCVAFPDIKVDGPLGPGAPREIILDRKDIEALNLSLDRIFDHWGIRSNISITKIETIADHLAPTTKVTRLFSDDLDDANAHLIALTREQMDILQNLRRTRKAVIIGGAGTGKTLLAMEKARILSKEGVRSLILCYNAPLRRYIAEAMREVQHVEVETFHSLVVREARRAKIRIPQQLDDRWFEIEAPRVLRQSISESKCRYESLLLDEAQDFSKSWLEVSVELLATEDSVLYLFADSHQDLYCRDWAIPHGCLEFELTQNCRNTRPVAAKVSKVFGDVLSDRGVHGPAPVFVETDRREEAIQMVKNVAARLVEEQGVRPEQLIVLTDDPEIIKELRATGVADVLFTTLNGHGIPVESIARFKGLECDTVLLALTDKLASDDARALAYVGLSRARVGLYVFGSPKVREALTWDSAA